MSEETIESLYELLAEHPQLVELFARHVKADLDAQAAGYLKEDYRQIGLFQRRLFKTWKAPILRLDAMLVCSLEISSEINEEYRRGEVANPNQLNVATRLHARAIHIAKEISHLLKGGYADGAMARWRSLHETSVIASFLSEGDEQLSVRFSDYQAVERLKAAKTYVDHQDFLDFERIPPEQVAKYETEVEELCQKYGINFRKDYGWACEKFLNPKRITFRDIEEAVKLHFLRVHYGFASKNVHSGIDSIGYKLGLSMSGEDILLAGPSNEGLIEPFQCTSLSVCQATDALVALAPNTYRDVGSEILWQMHESMKNEAVEAKDALLIKGKRMQARLKRRKDNGDNI
ncbi:DUF5677 domain-containing protein [Alcaligenes faecalis subsp. phenolicus]|uniref:DUF5677 domain-containing protein n=1 Tax=Alcaligenes nematophilus TaxID=2994643 RepID=UPI002AA3621B|nr:DUF5677 domain-containing protein [Alcaligenes phenolicus]